MKYLALAGVAIVAVALIAGTVLAGHGGYHLAWWTVDGGGTVDMQSGDGTYTLSGTAGQADAGTLDSNDGSYRLEGGYWGQTEESAVPPMPSPQHDVYLPAVIRK